MYLPGANYEISSWSLLMPDSRGIQTLHCCVGQLEQIALYVGCNSGLCYAFSSTSVRVALYEKNQTGSYCPENSI